MNPAVSVGFVQTAPQLLSVRHNVHTLVSLLEGVRNALIVAPELATSGYAFSSACDLRSVAEPADLSSSPSLASLHSVCSANNLHLLVGFPELSGDLIFNSASLISPSGILATYRKIHLFHNEKDFFSPGNSPPPVIDLPGIARTGVMICYDWYFPEAARSLSSRGAQIILHPANLVLPWCLDAMKTRSIENRVFSVTSNRTGTDPHPDGDLVFYGRSQVISPDGEILISSQPGFTGVLTVDIEPSSADDKSITSKSPGMSELRTDLLPLS